MKKPEGKNTRYYIDLNLEDRTIIGWDFEQRDKIDQKLAKPFQQRIFITKGQYNKLRKI